MQVLSVRDVAERLGVTPRTVRRWITGGIIRSVKAGGVRRIPWEEVDRLLTPSTTEQKLRRDPGASNEVHIREMVSEAFMGRRLQSVEALHQDVRNYAKTRRDAFEGGLKLCAQRIEAAAKELAAIREELADGDYGWDTHCEALSRGTAGAYHVVLVLQIALLRGVGAEAAEKHVAYAREFLGVVHRGLVGGTAEDRRRAVDALWDLLPPDGDDLHPEVKP